MEITAIDIVLAIPMVYMMYKGWRRGLVREVATLVGVLAGIWAAVHLSQRVAEMLDLQGEQTILVAFFICFAGAMVLAFLIGRLVENLMKTTHTNILNHVAGAAVGLAISVCILAVVLDGIVTLDKKEMIVKHEAKEKSLLYNPVYNTGSELTASLKEYIARIEDLGLGISAVGSGGHNGKK